LGPAPQRTWDWAARGHERSTARAMRCAHGLRGGPLACGVSLHSGGAQPGPQARQRARRGALQEELTAMPRSPRRLARTTAELAELTALRTRYAVALRDLHAEARQLGRLLTAMETDPTAPRTAEQDQLPAQLRHNGERTAALMMEYQQAHAALQQRWVVRDTFPR
jgi:hypothetical protein